MIKSTCTYTHNRSDPRDDNHRLHKTCLFGAAPIISKDVYVCAHKSNKCFRNSIYSICGSFALFLVCAESGLFGVKKSKTQRCSPSLFSVFKCTQTPFECNKFVSISVDCKWKKNFYNNFHSKRNSNDDNRKNTSQGKWIECDRFKSFRSEIKTLPILSFFCPILFYLKCHNIFTVPIRPFVRPPFSFPSLETTLDIVTQSTFVSLVLFKNTFCAIVLQKKIVFLDVRI